MSEALIIIALGVFLLRPPRTDFSNFLGIFMIIYGHICALGHFFGGQP